MKRRIPLYIVTIVLAMTACLVAQAQVRQGESPALNGSAVMENGVIKQEPHAFTVGWHYYNVNFCAMFKDGDTHWLYLYATNGSNFYTPDPVLQAVITPGCQSQNQFAIYTYDADGHWNAVAMYPWK
jgi:hypothetical protein